MQDAATVEAQRDETAQLAERGGRDDEEISGGDVLG